VALGQCPSALNAGVNLLLTPNTTAMTQKAGMLALDGRCKTLSPAADGYARADTCGVMLLLPAADSAAAGNGGALALVAGTAVNQDGRSSSLTAPNGPSQQEVVRAALATSGQPPAAVAALQMHGTGVWMAHATRDESAGSVRSLHGSCACRKESHTSTRGSVIHLCPPNCPLQAPPWETPLRWGPWQQRSWEAARLAPRWH